MHIVSRLVAGFATLALAGVLVTSGLPARASDHQDTLYLANSRPGADLTDVFVFPAADPDKVVLAMDVHPLIPAGEGMTASFDPGVMYQFHIAHGKYNYTQDQVIQFKATGTGPSQTISMYGPARVSGGVTAHWVNASGDVTYNRITKLGKGVIVYAGPRQDPFYFDLARFLKILPDRDFKSQPRPPLASAMCFRSAAQAQDFLASFNVLALVIEVPRKMLADTTGNTGIIHVWATTSTSTDGHTYTQIERLGRPAIKEGTELFKNHDATNRALPTDDAVLSHSIYTFVTHTAHRSPETARALVKVLIPDELVVNLAASGPARYLGVETNGKSGLPTGIVRVVPNGGILGIKKALDDPLRQFGGRDLSSPVMDLSLGAIFGSLPGKLGLAADDHKETPCLTSDNVTPPSRGITKGFPYYGPAI